LHSQRRRADDDANEIAQPGFRHRSSSFGAFAAVAVEIATVQRSGAIFA
jgi:hypothetical protein